MGIAMTILSYNDNYSSLFTYVSRENRYLLFLTENYAALDILEHYIRGNKHSRSELSTDMSVENLASLKPFTLFGSSFPKDKEYTQVNGIHGLVT